MISYRGTFKRVNHLLSTAPVSGDAVYNALHS
jgi:hypothetical protein